MTDLSSPKSKSGFMKSKFLIFLNLNFDISLKSLSKFIYPELFVKLFMNGF